MGKFVKKIEFSQEFDGDQVKFTCRPMDKATALAMHSFKKAPAFEDDGTTPVIDSVTGRQKMTMTDESMKLMVDSFEKHTESVSGIRDADGNAVDLATVFGSAYFVSLAISAATEWAQRSLAGN